MIRYLLSEQYQSDIEFIEYLQERMEIESDMILSCIENNVILEAETVKNKTSWIDKSKEIMHKIFNRFIDKFKNANTENKLKWFDDNKHKFANIDYSGLSTNMSPRWKYSTESMTNTMNNIINMLNDNNKPNPNELDNLTSRENVEKYKEFGKITIDGKTFGESLKIKFSGGTKEEPKLITINETSSPTFSDICLNYAIPYIREYKKNVNNARTSLRNFDTKLDNIERELNRRDKTELKESYCLIEDCYLSESSIYYLLEADENNENKTEGAKINDNKTEEKPKEGKVIDNKKEIAPNLSTMSTKELQYYKICINLIQLTIATYLTEIEKRFNMYIQILQNTLSSRKDTIKEEPKKKETNKEKN